MKKAKMIAILDCRNRELKRINPAFYNIDDQIRLLKEQGEKPVRVVERNR